MTGDFLKTKIKMSGFQQVEVAEKLGITPQHLESKLKSQDIKVSFLLEVARAINKNIYYFFDGLSDEFFLKKHLETENPDVALGEIKVKEKADQFILTQIVELLSQKLSPNFDETKSNFNVLMEAQSRMILTQGEVLDRLEELVENFKNVKNT